MRPPIGAAVTALPATVFLSLQQLLLLRYSVLLSSPCRILLLMSESVVFVCCSSKQSGHICRHSCARGFRWCCCCFCYANRQRKTLKRDAADQQVVTAAASNIYCEHAAAAAGVVAAVRAHWFRMLLLNAFTLIFAFTTHQKKKNASTRKKIAKFHAIPRC